MMQFQQFLSIMKKHLNLNLDYQVKGEAHSNKKRGGVEYYNPSSVRLPGEWILIDCDVPNRPNATLSFKPDGIKDTIYDLPIDHEKIELTSKNVFNITRLTHYDSGEYTCDFDGQQSNPTIGKRGQKVIVLNKGKAYVEAYIKKKPNATCYDVGSIIHLTCEAEKNTNLYEIIWYRQDSQGSLITLKSALNGPGTLTLTLNTLSKETADSYKCVISRPQVNYYSSRVVKITLKEEIKYYDPSHVRLTGEWISIKSCSFSFSRDISFKPLGTTNILYDFIVDNDKLKLVNSKTVNITRLTHKDSGQYICTLVKKENPQLIIGVPERYDVIVLEKGHREAKIKKKPNYSYYDDGNNVNLTCEAEKNTNLYEITWYKPDSQGNPVKLKSERNGTGMLTLTLASLSKKDTGQYTCVISRPQVNYRNARFVDITVKVKPEMLSHEETRVFRKGGVLNCTLRNAGEVQPPQLKYTWFSCDHINDCDENRMFKVETYSFELKSQTQAVKKYRCIATNAAGSDSKIVTVINQGNPTSFGQKRTIILVPATAGFIFLIVLIVICYVLYKRKKIYGGFYFFTFPPLPDYTEMLDRNNNIREQIHKLPFIPEWEFPRDRITFVSELDSGQFGVVWLAEAVGISAFRPRDLLKERASGKRFSFFWRKGKKPGYLHRKELTNVAVKCIKENGDQNSLLDLQSELKILIHVGENENIVNILGACTKGKRSNLWVIMEYCPHGNLRNLLRSSRNFYDVDEETLVPDSYGSKIGPKSLMYFSWQIANGLAFLSSRKIIHRDLALRNILLGNGFVAKIGDFGLARDIYKYHAYHKKSSGLLPIKWMAIESIRDLIFTEKSDVWSFGILLWELFTLGESPYPGIPTHEVYPSLLNGRRMEPPIHCPSEITEVMSQCWNENPDDRPHCHTLKEMLYKIICFERMSQSDQIPNTTTAAVVT